MPVKLRLFGLGSAAALALSMAAMAQPPKPPAGPPTSPGKEKAPPPAAGGYLERKFGLSSAEAQRQQQMQIDASDFALKIEQQYSGHFIGSFVDHAPQFRHTIVLDTDVPASEVARLAPPSLRSVVQVKRSRLSVADVAAHRTAIAQAVATAVKSFSLSYNIRSDKFDLSVPEDADQQKIVQAIPAQYKDEVSLKRGGTFRLMQSGVQAGDALYGGWMWYDETYAPRCTFGFVVRSSSAQNGVTTAHHCLTGQTNVSEQSTHWVTMGAPFADDYRSGAQRAYDFRAHYTGSLTTGPWVWGDNNRSGTYYAFDGSQKQWANVEPRFSTSGQYLQVTGVIYGGSSNAGHPVGNIMCKQGRETGLTCGTISSSWSDIYAIGPSGTQEEYIGYVEVSDSQEMVIAYGGDSGGAVFTDPFYDSTTGQYAIRAGGLLNIGPTRSGYGGQTRPCITPDDGFCAFYYMPIDLINDKQPMTIVTSAGAVSP
jgi:hypothetical protein